MNLYRVTISYSPTSTTTEYLLSPSNAGAARYAFQKLACDMTPSVPVLSIDKVTDINPHDRGTSKISLENVFTSDNDIGEVYNHTDVVWGSDADRVTALLELGRCYSL